MEIQFKICNLSLGIISMKLEQENKNMKSTKIRLIFTDNQTCWMEKWVVCFVFSTENKLHLQEKKKMKAKIFKPETEVHFRILMLK